MGLNGQPFSVVKFRSMRTDAEKDGVSPLGDPEPNDPRLIRASVGSLQGADELPKLFNAAAR